MMRVFVSALAALLVAIGAVVGVMAWRTSSFSKDGAQAEPYSLPDPPDFDLAAAADSLAAAIRLPTVTYVSSDPQPGADQPWLDLRAHVEARYPTIFAQTVTETVAGYSLLITWAGSDASLDPMILMAHQDVVPINPGTESDWTHGPFGGVVADGYIWGRGAIDDKSAMIGILEAADALAKSGWTPRRTILFSFGHDEEVSGAGAQAIFALLKTRGVKPALVLDEGYAVLETYPLTGKQAALIGVAEKGYLTLQITAETAGGHSSRPPYNSGAVRIARALIALEDNQMPVDLEAPPFMEMIEAVSGDRPYATRFAFANRWLLGGAIRSQLTDETSNAIVRTTTAPTMLNGSIKDNVLPQRASAVVNFRIHPNDTTESVIQHVRDVTAGIEGLKIEVYGDSLGSEPSPVSSTNSDAWRILSAVAKDVGDGAPVAPALVIGATDARYASAISDDAIYRFVPAIYGDNELTGFHGTNERMSVENLGRMIRGYAQLMLAMGDPAN